MLFFIALFGLLAWNYLLFFHRGFWRADQRLPLNLKKLDAWPSVAAVIPARNEAETIGAVTAALLTQNYAGKFRVVVVDDASTDGTGDIARGTPGAHHLDVITAPPAGLDRKLAALNAGLQFLESDAPEYLWFTDADIVHPPETLTRLVSKAVTSKRDLVSLMVRLRCESLWEKRLIPAFIFFFQMLYPFAAANDDRSKVAAAAGGCVLLRRTALAKAGGLEAISSRIIDDCALAGIIKRSGGKLWLGLTDAGKTEVSRSLRRADKLEPLWSMVRRTAFTQLNYSFPTLFLTLMGLALVFVAPPLLFLTLPFHGQIFPALMGLLAWTAMALAYGPTLRDYGRSPWAGLLLPMMAALYGAMTFSSAVAHVQRRGGGWKGRHYGPSSGPGNLSESP